MRAIIITHPGEPDVLQVAEQPTPVPGPNQVLIKVKAAGINRPDVFQRKGNYPPPPGAPQNIPGLEVAGIIEQCGPQVTRWKKGDKVCALVIGGGYAEYVVAHAGQCLPIPINLNFAQAASLPETLFTVWHNVFQRGRLQSGENFLVHGGTSGIGITAIQLAKAFGAKVFTTAGSSEKCAACLQLGADVCINYKEKSFEVELKEEGMDVILDMVGGDYINKNIHLLRAEGRLVFINAVQGNEAVINAHYLMQKRLTITGSTLRAREDDFKTKLAVDIERCVWPIIKAGMFKPVIYKEIPFENANEAHTLMESSEHIGKIILKVN